MATRRNSPTILAPSRSAVSSTKLTARRSWISRATSVRASTSKRPFFIVCSGVHGMGCTLNGMPHGRRPDRHQASKSSSTVWGATRNRRASITATASRIEGARSCRRRPTRPEPPRSRCERAPAWTLRADLATLAVHHGTSCDDTGTFFPIAVVGHAGDGTFHLSDIIDPQQPGELADARCEPWLSVRRAAAGTASSAAR